MIERLAEAAVTRAIERLAAAADALPGDVAIARTDGCIVLTGPDLARRAIEDGRLRWFGLVEGGQR